jgi:hypothetical protein
MQMVDNLASIDELFERREHVRYADGYTYFCRECGLECNVSEMPFGCQEGRIFPIYIKCRYGCGKSWHLEIFPTAKVSLH